MGELCTDRRVKLRTTLSDYRKHRLAEKLNLGLVQKGSTAIYYRLLDNNPNRSGKRETNNTLSNFLHGINNRPCILNPSLTTR